MSEVGTSFELAAVIVNHNQTAAALDQLRKYAKDAPAEFRAVDWVVVHNGDDEPFDADEQGLTNVRVVATPNRGYGAAVDLAASLTSAPYLLALNSDLVPLPEFLGELFQLIKRLRLEDRVGVVGCRLLNDDGRPQGSFGPFPNLWRLCTGLLRPRAVRKYWTPSETESREVPWATGACVLLDRRCFDQLGGFDERFFMYYEDVDYCKRVWEAGWRVLYHPGPATRHSQPYHSRRLTYQMARLARRSLLVYYWKQRPKWEFLAVSWIVRLECRMRRHDPGWRDLAAMVERTIRDPGAVPVGVP